MAKLVNHGTIDCKGAFGEALKRLKEIMSVCNKAWPESKFYILNPKSGAFNRLIWVEEHLSMAAFEEWEKVRGENADFVKSIENFGERFALTANEMFSLIDE